MSDLPGINQILNDIRRYALKHYDRQFGKEVFGELASFVEDLEPVDREAYGPIFDAALEKLESKWQNMPKDTKKAKARHVKLHACKVLLLIHSLMVDNAGPEHFEDALHVMLALGGWVQRLATHTGDDSISGVLFDAERREKAAKDRLRGWRESCFGQFSADFEARLLEAWPEWWSEEHLMHNKATNRILAESDFVAYAQALRELGGKNAITDLRKHALKLAAQVARREGWNERIKGGQRLP